MAVVSPDLHMTTDRAAATTSAMTGHARIVDRHPSIDTDKDTTGTKRRTLTTTAAGVAHHRITLHVLNNHMTTSVAVAHRYSTLHMLTTAVGVVRLHSPLAVLKTAGARAAEVAVLAIAAAAVNGAMTDMTGIVRIDNAASRSPLR